ncbi:hypothetical protein PanWU01x14_314320 [Parasponia andersonii]|uniref:Pollen Ole e 1 allergen and extensin family protein n=1 Tax=Parasponia andersonii TaxID=3476 RepID=A0A2P5ANR9_PARAD|nr:hypothetical protein PanWU01x14_314320 [Parasponia andersonii]
MAYPSPVLLFIASLLIAMNSVAHRILPNHNLPDVTSNNIAPQPAVVIPGVLRCFIPPLSCPQDTPLVAGVNVILSCDGGRTAIANALTHTSGFFQIVVDSSSSILFGASNSNDCRIIPVLPIAGCGVFAPTGVVDDPLGAVKTLTENLFRNDDSQVVSMAAICNAQSNSDQSKVHHEHAISSAQSSYYDPSTLHA